MCWGAGKERHVGGPNGPGLNHLSLGFPLLLAGVGSFGGVWGRLREGRALGEFFGLSFSAMLSSWANPQAYHDGSAVRRVSRIHGRHDSGPFLSRQILPSTNTKGPSRPLWGVGSSGGAAGWLWGPGIWRGGMRSFQCDREVPACPSVSLERAFRGSFAFRRGVTGAVGRAAECRLVSHPC